MRRSHNNNESAYARVRQDYAAAVACNVLGISSTENLSTGVYLPAYTTIH
jgi:hypothetical protein